MKPRVLGRLVAHPPFLLLVECQIARGKSQTGAHSIAIRTRTDRKNLQPVVGIAAIVAEGMGRAAVIAYQNVEVAVVVRSPAESLRRAPTPSRFERVPIGRICSQWLALPPSRSEERRGRKGKECRC